MNATERADAIARAITACTHPDANQGAHAYRDGICRCGAPKRNADGSVPIVPGTDPVRPIVTPATLAPACYHPRSCPACGRHGRTCGLHRVGDVEHRLCTGTPADGSASAVRIKAPSGNPDNDYWQATCGECPWKGALYSNRTVEGRTLADRDAAGHRCDLP